MRRMLCLQRDAALCEEGAGHGGEYGDDELDDGLPSLHVFKDLHKCKVWFVVCY